MGRVVTDLKSLAELLLTVALFALLTGGAILTLAWTLGTATTVFCEAARRVCGG